MKLKKQVCITLALVLCVGTLAGCGKMKASDTVVDMGDQKISLGVANFYARFYEGMYESYYGIDEASWTSPIGDDEEVTYESSVKDMVLENLENMYLEKAHMSEYDVTITDEEKADIKESVDEFIKNNELEAKDVVTGDEDTVTEFLTLLTIQNKMQEAMVKDVDTEVSDEDATQKKMSYVLFPFTTTDEDGNTTALSDEDKATLKTTAETFAEGAKTADDFAAYAEKAGTTASDATFDTDSTDPEEALVKAADKLDEGSVSDVIEGESGYYVAKLTSLLDKDATDAKKTEIVDQRKQDQIDSLLKKWKKEADIKVHTSTWKKVDFTKQGIKMIQDEETTPGSEDTTSSTAE